MLQVLELRCDPEGEWLGALADAYAAAGSPAEKDRLMRALAHGDVRRTLPFSLSGKVRFLSAFLMLLSCFFRERF